MSCNHENFEAQVHVIRQTEDETSNKVIGYMSEIQIRCKQCGLPFEFMGVDNGISTFRPMASIDNTELRAPIKPTTDPVAHVNVLLNNNSDNK